MPKLATGANSPQPRVTTAPPAASGFTLIEVLVVVIIAGVLTGAVLLVLGQSGPAQINKRELQRLTVSLDAMCDQALLSGSVRGLRFHPEGYDFWRFQSGTWRPTRTGSRPGPVRWREGLRPRVRIGDIELRPVGSQRLPQVICTGIEPPTPFVIELGSGEYRQHLSWPR